MYKRFYTYIWLPLHQQLSAHMKKDVNRIAGHHIPPIRLYFV